MGVKENDKIKEPLSHEELKHIFETLKKSGDSVLEKKLYDAYKPFLIKVAKDNGIEKSRATDLYNEVFSKLYDLIWRGKQKPENFGMLLQNTLAKECLHISAVQNEEISLQKESLTNQKIVREANIAEARRMRDEEFNRQSILMVISILDEIARDAELRKAYKITSVQISLVRDYYGINAKNISYTVTELAEKYAMSELMVKGLLRSGMEQIRKIEELDSIKKR